MVYNDKKPTIQLVFFVDAMLLHAIIGYKCTYWFSMYAL